MDSIKVFGIYQEEFDKLRQTFRIKVRVTKDEAQKYPGLQEGDEMFADPTPTTPAEAYKLLTDYYAMMHFVAFKDMGLRKYHVWNKASLKTEIDRIEEFRSYAELTSYDDAVSDHHSFPVPEEYIYLKWINGFYEHASLVTLMGYNNTREAQVYAEYFLYYEWLKSELSLLTETAPSDNSEADLGDQIHQQGKPTIAAYAIMHFYLSKPITKYNKAELGSEYGFANGDALYNRYLFWRDDGNRLLHHDNTTKNNSRIKNFKLAMDLLKTRNQKAFQAAEKDLKNLIGKI